MRPEERAAEAQGLPIRRVLIRAFAGLCCLMLIPVALVSSLAGLGRVQNRQKKRAIVRHVQAEHAALKEAAELALQTRNSAAGRPEWAKEARLLPEEALVIYETFSEGIVPSGMSMGYCYARDGEPHACSAWNDYSDFPRIEHGNGWRWEDGRGNGCYVEQVIGKLYYWEETW